MTASSPTVFNPVNFCDFYDENLLAGLENLPSTKDLAIHKYDKTSKYSIYQNKNGLLKFLEIDDKLILSQIRGIKSKEPSREKEFLKFIASHSDFFNEENTKLSLIAKLEFSRYDSHDYQADQERNKRLNENDCFITRIKYSLFYVFILELQDFSDTKEECEKKLETAYKILIGANENANLISKDIFDRINISYFDNVQGHYRTALSYRQLNAEILRFNHSMNEVGRSLQGRIVGVVLESLGTKSTIESQSMYNEKHVGQFIVTGLASKVNELSRIIFELSILSIVVRTIEESSNSFIRSRLEEGFIIDQIELNNVLISLKDCLTRFFQDAEYFISTVKYAEPRITTDKLLELFNKYYEEARLGKTNLGSIISKESKFWKNILSFYSKTGVGLLESQVQLKNSNAKSYTLVVDPWLEPSPEVRFVMGCFTDLIIRNEECNFFICTKDYFYSSILQSDTKLAREKASLYQHENEKLLKIDLNFNNASRNDSVKRKSTNQSESLTETKIAKTENKKTIREINILLLGESGVGKSTFVNAYYNYLKFNTLDEATKHESLRSLICSTFSYTDNQYNIKTVTIKQNPDQGEGETEDDDTVDAVANEVFIPGQSSTQHAKSYKFMKDDMLIRIIDTPGIGDSRGVKMDQENFKNTIKYISKLTHLNAICILLKPNIKRMELQTRYCIKELFSHLNKVSIKNLIFCFTNTRSTSFRPGDTLPSLQAFIRDEIEAHSGVKVPLNERNIICVDNEAFRYLVLTKDMKDDPSELDKFDMLNQYPSLVRSWDISKKSSEKLIEYTLNLPILEIKHVVCYNVSRNIPVQIVEDCVNGILRLARNLSQLESKGHGSHDNPSLKEKHISEILLRVIHQMAMITFNLRYFSITIFNDQFDAYLEETILKLNHSHDPEDSRTSALLKQIKSAYYEELNGLNNSNASQHFDIGQEIEKLISLVN